jgi:hypothetical protein
MSSYEIYLREEWEPSTLKSSPPVSHWTWSVSLDGSPVDNGKVEYGGDTGERDARRRAEAAATLHAKRENAKRIEYDFTPEG